MAFNNDAKFENVYSKKVKAGSRRTYFFDVRKTRGEDYFITLTESTKKPNSDHYERHKIFLYKEDFAKFVEALQEAVDHVKNDLMADFDFSQFEVETEKSDSSGQFGEELKWE